MSHVDCFRDEVKPIPHASLALILTPVDDKVCLDAIGRGFTINLLSILQTLLDTGVFMSPLGEEESSKHIAGEFRLPLRG